MDEKPKVVFPNPWEPGPGNGQVQGNRDLTPEWGQGRSATQLSILFEVIKDRTSYKKSENCSQGSQTVLKRKCHKTNCLSSYFPTIHPRTSARAWLNTVIVGQVDLNANIQGRKMSQINICYPCLRQHS